MPEFFKQEPLNNVPVSGDFTTNTPIAPVSISTGDPAPAGNKLDAIFRKIALDPAHKAQRYNTPILQTPVKNAPQYLYYAEDIGYDALDPNLEQKYEARQGIWDSVKNRAAKIGVNAFIGLYSGFASTFDFISGRGTEGMATNEGLNILNQASEEINGKLPNFKSQYDIDNPYFNTHLAGQTFESLGFTAGAIGSSLLIDALIAPLTEGVGSALLLPRQLQMITSKWGKLSNALVDGGKDYKTLLKSLDEAGELSQGVDKALKSFDRYNKVTNLTRFGLNVGVSSLGESAIEANQVYREIRKNLMDQTVDEYGNYNGGQELLGRIENTAREGGANTVLPNFMFLALSNSLGMGAILRPSRAAIKATEEALGSRVALNITNPNTISAAVTPYSKGFLGMIERLQSPTALVKDNIREAFEEGYQFVVSDANKNYYQRKFNARSNNDISSMQEEYYNSIGRAFTTEEGIQSMIMGFGGGAIQNGVKRVANRVRGIKSGADLAAQIQKNLNTYTTTSIFNSPRTEAVTSENILREMETAAANGDVLQYKNLQLEALFNWVHSGVKNHKFDARLDQLESLKGIDPESFQTMWGVNFNDSNKKTVDEFIDAVKNKAIDIKNNVEKIETAFGKNNFNKEESPLKYASFENYKQELALSLSQLNDYRRRVSSIKDNISASLPAMNLDEVVELSSVEGIRNTIERFNTRISELKNSEELAKGNKDLVNTFKEEREFLERRVKEMNWATTDNQNYTQDFLGTINSIHNYYGNGKTVRGNFSISELDSYNILANSKDVNTLFKEMERVSNYYRDLTGNEGYMNFERKYTKDVTDYMDNIIITSDGKVKVKEPDAPKTKEAAIKEAGEFIDDALNNLGVADLDAVREEIKNGNVVVTPRGLRKKPANAPEVTEEEKDEALALLSTWDIPNAEEMFFGNIAPREKMRPIPEDGSVREKAEQLEEEEEDRPSAKEEPTSTIVEGVEEDEEVLAPSDKGWKNAVFKFYNYFNKINSWKNKTEDFLGELLKVLTSNSKSDVIDNLTFKLEPAPNTSKKPVKVPLYVKQKDGSYKKKYTDLKAGQYKQNVEVWFKNKKIGVLQEPERMGFESADGRFIPLGTVTDVQQYVDLTLNSPDTFEAFKAEYNAYKSSYDKIINKAGKKKTFTNAEVKALFTPMINYGRIATTKNDEFTLPVSELQLWEGSGIISLDKTGDIVVLNSSELSTEDLNDLFDFAASTNIREKLLKSGRDYFVISKLPDGRFTDKLSIIYARSTDLNLDVEKVFEMFSKKESLDGVSVTVKSKDHGNTKLTFEHQPNGDVQMTMRNRKRSVRQVFTLPASEVESAANAEDIVDIVNNALTKINNPLLRKVDMKVRSNDFMVSGINEKTSLKDIKRNLTAAVSSPTIYTGFSINFYPKGFSPTVAPTTPAPETTTPEPAPTEPVTPTPAAPTAPEPVVTTLDIVPENEYTEFIDKNIVSEERLNSIADKVIAKEDLSPYEVAIFTGKTPEINEIIRRRAEANEPTEDKIIDDNMASIISQLESRGILTKNCD